VVVRHNNCTGLFVRNELPHPIRGENNELVAFKQIHFRDLGRCNDTDLSGGIVSKRPRHCQTGDVFLEMPNAKRAEGISVHVSIGLYSTAVFNDTRFLIREICLVVSIQSNRVDGAIWTHSATKCRP